jgi:hypothetical protein
MPVKPLPRPKSVHSTTRRIRTGQGHMYITVGVVDSKPFEVFAHVGKQGTDVYANAEEISRLVTLALRSGVDVNEIINTLMNIRGSQPIWWEGVEITGIGDAIAKVLSTVIRRSNRSPVKHKMGWHSWLKRVSPPKGEVELMAYSLALMVEPRRRRDRLHMYNKEQRYHISSWSEGKGPDFAEELEIIYDGIVGAFLHGFLWPREIKNA